MMICSQLPSDKHSELENPRNFQLGKSTLTQWAIFSIASCEIRRGYPRGLPRLFKGYPRGILKNPSVLQRGCFLRRGNEDSAEEVPYGAAGVDGKIDSHGFLLPSNYRGASSEDVPIIQFYSTLKPWCKMLRTSCAI